MGFPILYSKRIKETQWRRKPTTAHVTAVQSPLRPRLTSIKERRAVIARFAPSRVFGSRSCSLKILKSKKAKTSCPITRGFRLANPRLTFYRFCKTCGVRTFAEGNGGKFYAVAIATLDGIEQDADQLVKSLKYNDGRHDDLKHEPADTRLL